MRIRIPSSLLAIAAVIAASVILTGCGSKLEGTYVPAEGEGLISSITFKSGGKCELVGLGMTKEGTYELEGSKVKITVAGDTTILTIDDKGCLDGGGLIGRFCKSTAGSKSSANVSSSDAPAAAKGGSPSGAYECRLPDGTTFTLEFSGGGKVKMISIEGGARDEHDGQWTLNGDDILVQGADGMMMNMKRNGNNLTADLGGMQMTFVKK